MANYADEYTEKSLEKLERKIAREYARAAKDGKKMAEEFFSKFDARITEEEEFLRAAYMDKAAFAKWYEENRGHVSALDIDEIYKKRTHLNSYSSDYQTAKTQFANYKRTLIARGERFEQVCEDMAKRAADANAVACAYINDNTPSIFTLNYNYNALKIEQWAVDVGGMAEGSVAFNVLNENAVKNLVTNADSLIPRVSADRAIDTAYNIKKVQSIVTSGIMTGKPVRKIADDLMGVYGSNRASALRNARTSYATAQNSGHLSAMQAAQDMGIKMQKVWRCIHDNRTRFSHAMMDTETVDIDMPFSNDLMYPGDRDGDIEEWINCRCRLLSSIDGVSDPPEDTYADWIAEHTEASPRSWNSEQLEYLEGLRK